MDGVLVSASILPVTSFITQNNHADKFVFALAFTYLVMLMLVLILMLAFLFIFEFLFIVVLFCSFLICPGVIWATCSCSPIWLNHSFCHGIDA